MFKKNTKRNIQLVFLLAFAGLNVFFFLFYDNLRKVEEDHRKINDAASSISVLSSVNKDVEHLKLSIRELADSANDRALRQVRIELDTLLADTALLMSCQNLVLNDSLISLVHGLIEKRISAAESMLQLAQSDTVRPTPNLKNEITTEPRDNLDSALIALEIRNQSLLQESNTQQTKITRDTFNKFHLLALLFNILFLVFYFFVLRNIKLQEQRDRFLQRRVQMQATELSKVYERITDAFLALDNEWRYTYVNSKSLEYHGGIPADQLLGKVIWEVTPELVKEPFYKALHDAKATHQPMRMELYYAQKGIWFEDLIYPTEEGVLVFYHEITEKKNAELAVRASEKKLKQAYEQFRYVGKATNDALYDWHMAENNIWGNDAFNNFFSISEEQSVRYAQFLDRIHPDDVKKVAANFNDTTKEKSTYLSEEFRFEVGGNYRTMYNRAYLLYDQDGKAYRMVGAMQDITNLKLARQQVLLEKELSDSIINSLPGIFYIFNRKGKLFRWNKNLETITKYSRDEISKLHPLDFFDEPDRDSVLAKINNVFISGKDDVEAGLITREGKKIPYLFNGMLIQYEGEDCLMGVGIDLSEKVKAHNELRELTSHLQDIRENERTRIAREIHDELGQQLTGLKMDVSWLSRKMAAPQPEIQQKVSEILLLIDETVKTVRRISSQLRPSILDDLGLVAAMEWQSEEFQKRSEITTHFKTNAQAVSIAPDLATGLFRVFQESLTNISRHAKATRVNVELFVEDGILRLTIKDDGIGFDPGLIESKKTLGLLGMKERTLLMGGKFEITGIPGQGTTIIIMVPLPAKENI